MSVDRLPGPGPEAVPESAPEPAGGSADERLDRAFTALGDPVRRGVVARLSRGEATVNELADLFPAITKQAVSRHIAVLEAAGLITRSRDGQRRPCHLRPAALEELTGWIDGYRLEAERSFRRLDAVLRDIKENEKGQ